MQGNPAKKTTQPVAPGGGFTRFVMTLVHRDDYQACLNSRYFEQLDGSRPYRIVRVGVVARFFDEAHHMTRRVYPDYRFFRHKQEEAGKLFGPDRIETAEFV